MLQLRGRKQFENLLLQEDSKLFERLISKECNHWKGNLIKKYTLLKGVIRLLFYVR